MSYTSEEEIEIIPPKVVALAVSNHESLVENVHPFSNLQSSQNTF